MTEKNKKHTKVIDDDTCTFQCPKLTCTYSINIDNI